MVDRVGQQLGNYRLVRLLGKGGFAEVYLGEHLHLGTQAAVKVLYARLASKDDVEGFEREARTVAHLKHPHIVRVLDYDVEDDTPFLVMDYASNGSLRQRHPKGTRLPLSLIVQYVKQVSDALQYAHSEKFIHRDVKPENMLLGRRNEVLLSDFGVATVAHSTASLSAQGTVGTITYMAPEQIEGHPRAASDQYALGVVVYEWLCGERPFEGSLTEVMFKHLSRPPPSLRERMSTLPAEVEQVVLLALAKDPKERFASVQAFAATLEQASQLAPSRTVLLPPEQPSPDPSAAPSYPSAAVAPSQLGEPMEVTPTADVPREALEPTVLPVSLATSDLTTPPNRQTPHSLKEILRVLPRQYIKVLHRPSVATFSEEMGKAHWSLVGVQILGWMTILGMCGLLIVLVQALVLSLTGTLDLSGLGSNFGLTLLLALLIPMLLLVDTVLVYLIARAFGGRGTLVAQSYTCLLFQIPLSTISSLLTFIPVAGILLGVLFGFVAFIYGMLLQVFAVIAVHRLDARTATVAVFIPALVTLTLTWLIITIISATFAFA